MALLGVFMGKDSVGWKCPKCGSTGVREKTVMMGGSFGDFNKLYATAHICSECGYIELYAQ